MHERGGPAHRWAAIATPMTSQPEMGMIRSPFGGEYNREVETLL